MSKYSTNKDISRQNFRVDLPIKPGEFVYFIKSPVYGIPKKIDFTKINKIIIYCDTIYFVGWWHSWNKELLFTLDDFGKTVFLTRDEAENVFDIMCLFE